VRPDCRQRIARADEIARQGHEAEIRGLQQPHQDQRARPADVRDTMRQAIIDVAQQMVSTQAISVGCDHRTF
jgi:hypothetical protein